MILELQSLNNIGCTYDFTDRFEVSLASLEALGLMSKIRTKIPDCDDHCLKSKDCQWISIYQKQKSKSKFKLTKTGEKLVNDLIIINQKEDKIESLILDAINQSVLVDIIQSMIIDQKSISAEKLITEILKQTNVNLQTIRMNLRDIFDLMESLEIIRIKEGLLLTYG